MLFVKNTQIFSKSDVFYFSVLPFNLCFSLVLNSVQFCAYLLLMFPLYIMFLYISVSLTYISCLLFVCVPNQSITCFLLMFPSFMSFPSIFCFPSIINFLSIFCFLFIFICRLFSFFTQLLVTILFCVSRYFAIILCFPSLLFYPLFYISLLF